MAQRLRHMNPVKHSRMRLPVRPEEGSIGEGQLATDVPIGTSIVAKRTACKREAKEREKPGSSGCVRLRAAAAALLLLLQVARHATTYYKTKQQTTKMDNLCVRLFLTSQYCASLVVRLRGPSAVWGRSSLSGAVSPLLPEESYLTAHLCNRSENEADPTSRRFKIPMHLERADV